MNDDPDGMDDTDDGELWVDSADRAVALRALAEHRDSAHLTADEHDRRRDLVRGARTRADLRALFTDLPSPHPLMGEERDTWEATGAAPRGRGNGTGLVLGSGAVIVLGALVAGWWVPAILLACLVVVVAVLTAR